MIRYDNTEIRNESLRLSPQSVVFGCQIHDSVVTLARPEAVSIFETSFRRSTIEVEKTCTKRMSSCFFDECTFLGRYYDCRFGYENPPHKFHAGLRNCDFSRASLNLCSFWNCTPDDLKMPSWPHVTIFEEKKHADDFANLCVDPLLYVIHRSMQNSGAVALTYHLPTYLRQRRPEIIKSWEFQTFLAKTKREPPPPEPVFDLERMRQLLASKPYVYM